MKRTEAPTVHDYPRQAYSVPATYEVGRQQFLSFWTGFSQFL